MKLFFKHLLVSIKRKPLQPLILVLTLCVAIMACTLAFCIKNALVKEGELSQSATYGRAELFITLNSGSRSRFMFASEANKLLGDKGYAVGAYEIVMSLSQGEASFGAAVDFNEIDKMFDFEFTGYGTVSRESLSQIAFVTDTFAKERGLTVGDTFEARLFSSDVTYTVGGISNTVFLGKYNVMVDISGAVRALSQGSVIASALGESFKPSSVLYIDAGNGVSALDCMEALKKSPSFAEKTFTDTGAATKGQSNVGALNIAIDMSIILVCLLAAAITFCCFFILGDERGAENRSFAYAGATPLHLNLLQLAEITIYWLFGGVLGVPMSLALARWLGGAVGLKYARPAVSAGNVALTLLIMLAVCYLAAGMFILTRGKSFKKRNTTPMLIVLISVTLILVACVIFAPPGLRMKLGVVSLAVTLICMFVVVPKLLCLLMGAINKRLEGRHGVTPAIVYSVKNICSVKLLHNVARLSAMLTCVVTLSLTIIIGSFGNISLASDILSGDYVVLGATQRCSQRILECEEIEEVRQIYFSTAKLSSGLHVAIFSAEEENSLSPEFGVTVSPKGNGAVISRSVAKQFSLGVGDSLEVECDNKNLTLEITEITKSPMSFIFFDCNAAGVKPNILMPVAKENVSENDMLMALSEAVAEDVATVVPTGELLKDKISTTKVYSACGNVLLSIIIAFSVVGLADSLYNSYRARREELSLFCLSGMSRAELAKLKTWEIVLTLMTGAVFAALLCAAVIPITGHTLVSAGNDVLAGVEAYLWQGEIT